MCQCCHHFWLQCLPLPSIFYIMLVQWSSYTVCELLELEIKHPLIKLWLQLHGLKYLWASVWACSLLVASSKSEQGRCSCLQPGCGPSAGQFTPLKLCEAWWPYGWWGSLVMQTAVIWSDWLSTQQDPPGPIPEAVKVPHLKVTCSHLKPLACVGSQSQCGL